MWKNSFAEPEVTGKTTIKIKSSHSQDANNMKIYTLAMGAFCVGVFKGTYGHKTHNS